MSIKYRTSAGTSASNFTDLVVKVGDTLPIGTEVDYDGQTAPAGWQEVDDPNVYSTTEKRVGTWIDGKPIYRKCVSGTTPNNSTTDLVLNVDTLVNFNIIVLRTNNNQWHPVTSAMTGFDQNHACPVYYVISTTRVSLFINNSAYADQPYKGWVEYTKTTD